VLLPVATLGVRSDSRAGSASIAKVRGSGSIAGFASRGLEVVQLSVALFGEPAFRSLAEGVFTGTAVESHVHIDPDFGVRVARVDGRWGRFQPEA